MNAVIMIGIVLGAAVTVVDRFFHKVPNWLAILLYAAAVLLILTGMLCARAAGT